MAAKKKQDGRKVISTHEPSYDRRMIIEDGVGTFEIPAQHRLTIVEDEDRDGERVLSLEYERLTLAEMLDEIGPDPTRELDVWVEQATTVTEGAPAPKVEAKKVAKDEKADKKADEKE